MKTEQWMARGESIMEAKLSASEMDALSKSASVVRDTIAKLGRV